MQDGTTNEITAETYNSDYYGNGDAKPKANYCGYSPMSQPHWSIPLALWLWARCEPPFLDVGCAFGHLVRDLNRVWSGTGEHPAQGVEWSPYAFAGNVGEGQVWNADGRALPFGKDTFNTVVSLDFLEHHVPEDTVRCLREMDRVLRPNGSSVHLIGAHNPTEDLSRHLADPTHQNHEPLDWYLEQAAVLGWVYDLGASRDLAAQAAWAATDWAGRMVVWLKPAEQEQRK